MMKFLKNFGGKAIKSKIERIKKRDIGHSFLSTFQAKL